MTEDDLACVEAITRAAERIAWQHLLDMRAQGLPMSARRYCVWVEAMQPDGSPAVELPERSGDA